MAKTTKLKSSLLTPGLLGLVVGAFLSVIVLVVVAQGQITGILFKTKAISATGHAASQLATKFDAANALVGNYNALDRQTVTSINSALPTSVDFAELTVTMDRLTGDSGVRMQSISLSQEPTSTALASTSSANAPVPADFSINVNGSYTGIIALLKNLELSVRPMRVDNMSLSGATNSMSAQLLITTYYQNKADITDKTEVIR